MEKVGLILENARKEKGISLEEAALVTKIQPKFLEALEKGDYSVFSSAVYIKGFLRNYALFLGLDPGKVIAFWRREYEERGGGRVKKFLDPFLLPRFVVSPATVFTAVVLVLVAFFFGYIFWQFRSFSKAPFLEITNPLDGAVVSSFRINVVGKTEAGAEVFVNGEKVSVSESGVFALAVDLAKGINVLNFKAKNKLGKETEVSRTVIVLKKEEEEFKVAGESTMSATPSAGKRGI